MAPPIYGAELVSEVKRSLAAKSLERESVEGRPPCRPPSDQVMGLKGERKKWP